MPPGLRPPRHKKAHEHFTKHEKSNSHRESLYKIHQMKASPGMVLYLINRWRRHRSCIAACSWSSFHLYSTWHVSERAWTIEGNLIQLLLLCSEECSELKKWVKERHYLSSEILNEMLSVMGQAVAIQLLIKLHQALIYSLIAAGWSNWHHQYGAVMHFNLLGCVIHEEALELI